MSFKKTLALFMAWIFFKIGLRNKCYKCGSKLIEHYHPEPITDRDYVYKCLKGCFVLFFLLFIHNVNAATPTLANSIYGFGDSPFNATIPSGSIVRYNLTDGAYAFSGVANSRINLNALSFTNVTNSSTCAWFRTQVNSVTSNYIVGRLYGSSSGSRSGSLYIRSNGSITYYMRNGTTATDFNAFGSVVNVDQLYHACGTWNMTHISVYLNGSLNRIKATPRGRSAVGTEVSLIGESSVGSNSFQGEIDEVRIYNRSITASEVLTIFNAGRQKNATAVNNSLIRYYPFDDSGFLLITGTGEVNMTWLNNTILDNNKVNDTSTNQYILYSDLIINSATVNLSLTPTDGVTRLRLFSGKRFFTSIESRTLDLANITRVIIDSINGTAQFYDTNATDGRAYINLNANKVGSVLVYYNNISHLGDDDSPTSGFQIENANYSRIYHNYFYANGIGLFVRTSHHSIVYNNTIYNIHGNWSTSTTGSISRGIGSVTSRNITINRNVIYNVSNLGGNTTEQESMGIHCNRGCNGSIVKNNIIYDSDHGIIWFQDNNNTYIFNNTIYDIKITGIRLESTCTFCVVANNTIYRTGINQSKGGAGIHIFISSGEAPNRNNTIIYNVLRDNLQNIVLFTGLGSIIKHNRVINQTASTIVEPSVSLNHANGSVLYNNTINGAEDQALRIMNTFDVTINKMNLGNNTFDIDFFYNSGDIRFIDLNISNYDRSWRFRSIRVTDLYIETDNELKYTISTINQSQRLTAKYPLYLASGSSSTLKKIASNLSQAINATVRMNVAHTNIKDIVFINNNSRDYSPETWNFVGGQAEMILNNIAPDTNTVYIDYGTQPLGQQQTIKGRGILRFITEELPISVFGSKYSLPVWVTGIGIISLGILAMGLFSPVSFPLVLTLIVINALLIFTTISRSIS